MPGIEPERAAAFRVELLRRVGMLGHAPDADTEARLEQAAQRCAAAVRPRHVYAFFPLERRADGVAVCGTPLCLTGQSIARHLEGAGQCALMAVTLGMQAEREQRQLAASGQLTQAVLFDAACSAYIEVAADVCQDELAGAAARRGLRAGGRFSPGYGDLPLQVQGALLAALDTPRRLGLTLTDSLLMLPRKSITAIVPLFQSDDPAGSEE